LALSFASYTANNIAVAALIATVGVSRRGLGWIRAVTGTVISLVP
jgi:hypothetical protein